MTKRSQKATSPLHFEDERAFSRIGMIALATDLTSEHDFNRMLTGEDSRLHVTRISYSNPVNPETLKNMETGLAASAALIAPDTPLKAIYFSCTAGSAQLGDTTVRKQIQTARPHVPVITPLTAARHAFDALQVHKISILTPYTEDVAELISSYFTTRNLNIRKSVYMGLDDDRMMARISQKTIIETATAALTDDSDALFISCTALRSAEAVSAIENLTGRPVVTSNQAAAWLSALTAGTQLPDKRYGRLMSLQTTIS